MLARFAADQRRLLPRRPPEVTTPKDLNLPAGAASLSEAESKALLQAFGIPIAREVFVPSGADAAVAATRARRRPIAVKIVSRDIPHKTEAGGVKLGVAKAALADAVCSVTAHAQGRETRRPRSMACSSRRWHRAIEALIGVINDEALAPSLRWRSAAC